MKTKPEDRKQYVFLAYNPEELKDIPDYDPPFYLGDVLARVYNPNDEGDSFKVLRLNDNHVDSVFPEEVEEL